MNPVQYTLSATGVGRPVLMDWLQNPFNVGINVSVVPAIADYSVEHTFDDILTVAPGSVRWFRNSGSPSPGPLNASKDFNYAFPVRAIRLNMIDGTGGGTATISIIQASEAP